MARSSTRAVLLSVIVVAAAVVALVVVLRLGDDGQRSRSGERPAAGPTPTLTRECAGVDYSDPAQGQVDWVDTFDGTSVDDARWTVRDATRLSFDDARILASNVSVSQGSLRIEARREPGGGREYTTGYLDTIGRSSQSYGRWEMRARLPVQPGRSRGLWPAFWLRADAHPGEIDVMEAWGTPVQEGRRLRGSSAWTVHEDTRSAPGTQSVTGWARGSGRLDSDFHTFAVDRSPECLRFSVDGRTTGSVSVERHPWLRSALASPLNIRLNLQVGSRYWGAPTAATALPAVFEVDEVRVFRPRDR